MCVQVSAVVSVSGSPGLEDEEARKSRASQDSLLAQTVKQGTLESFLDFWYQQPLWERYSILISKACACSFHLSHHEQFNLGFGILKLVHVRIILGFGVLKLVRVHFTFLINNILGFGVLVNIKNVIISLCSLRRHPNFEKIRKERTSHRNKDALAGALESLSSGLQP